VAVAPLGLLSRLAPLNAAATVGPVSSAVQGYAARHGGEGPRHAVQILVDPAAGLSASSFVRSDTATTADGVPVGATTLAELQLMPPNRRAAAAAEVALAMPPDVIAHRLGDFVFTYHGADLGSPDPQLWVVVAWPDPTVNPAPTAADAVAVGLGDGSTTSIPAAGFAARLAEQNRYRASLGLDPLPLPSLVTHDAPAIAP
jgi:hypothetical protein